MNGGDGPLVVQGPTGPDHRILQVHPSLLCNLECAHCYSTSGPDRRVGLEPEVLAAGIVQAAGEGYNVVGFSGGEPTLYAGLGELLDTAHANGMSTTVTTNGTTLTKRRVDVLRGRADVLAISLDGTPESHDRIRASPGAFASMTRKLDNVRNAGIPFGFIFTLTQHNVDELDWVAATAVSEGAVLLQVHPLEEVGRAREAMSGQHPDSTEATFAAIEVERLRASLGDRLRIQLDVAEVGAVAQYPDRFFAQDPDACGANHLPGLAHEVSPLVIEADGTVVPLQYGFPRNLAFGNLRDEPLASMAERWMSAQRRRFRASCRMAWREIAAVDGPAFVNWYAAVARCAAASNGGSSTSEASDRDRVALPGVKRLPDH